MRTAIFQITGILDNMLLRQLPVEQILFFFFCGWFDVFWCSCGFAELAPIGWCAIQDSRETPKRSICLGH